MEQAVPIFGRLFLQRWDGRAVDEVNVQITIIVVSEKGRPASIVSGRFLFAVGELSAAKWIPALSAISSNTIGPTAGAAAKIRSAPRNARVSHRIRVQHTTHPNGDERRTGAASDCCPPI